MEPLSARRPSGSLTARPKTLPTLPSMYQVPWSKRDPMFPSSTPRTPSSDGWTPDMRRPLRPIRLQTTFGAQVDSRRTSPVGIVFGVGGVIAAPPDAHKLPASLTPGPLSYTLTPSCGRQPLSPYMTASRVSLQMKEDRWQPMERIARANLTPGPSAYHPKS